MVTVDFDAQMALFLAPVHLQAFAACLWCPPISQMITRQTFLLNRSQVGKWWCPLYIAVYAGNVTCRDLPSEGCLVLDIF